MFDKMLSVGPPQMGSINEMSKEHLKLQPDIKQKNDAKDFKKALSKFSDTEEVHPRKSSGGTKKKMADDDDKKSDKDDDRKRVNVDPAMISNVMVSKEGEVEIADSEKNLSPVTEESISQSKIAKTSGFQVQLENQNQELNDQSQSAAKDAHLVNGQADLFGQNDQNNLELNPETINSESALSPVDVKVLSSLQNDAHDLKLNQLVNSDDVMAQSSDMKAALAAAAVLKKENSTAAQANIETSSKTLSAGQLTKEQSGSDRLAQQGDLSFNDSVQTNMMLKQARQAGSGHDSKNAENIFSQDVKSSLSVNENTFHSSSQRGTKSQDEFAHQEGKNDSAASKDSNSGRHEATDGLSFKSNLLSDLQQHFGQIKAMPHEAAAMASAGAALANHKSEEAAQVRELMNTAHFLVTRGGGEMTVKMTPDGLGEVQLKVMLNDGRINIEMNTHDKNVKKLIEDSLSELKSGLAVHQMKIENVKINSVQATATENQTHFQSQNQSDGRERQQMAFQQQFEQRQGSSGFSQRQSSQNKSDDLLNRNLSDRKIITEAIRARHNPYVSGTKGSGLNVVA